MGIGGTRESGYMAIERSLGRQFDHAIRWFNAAGLLVSMVIALAVPARVAHVAAANLQPVWTQVSTSGPATSAAASMAFDEATGQMILFGGSDGKGVSSRTSRWDGANWNTLTPSTSPSVRINASMAYDPATRQLILFGGKGADYLGDTWSWDGNTWTAANTPGPSARSGAGMAYDPSTRQLILFGGGDSTGQFGDTWAWNGTGWTKLDSSGPARVDLSMVYDPATQQIVLFGGTTAGTDLGDTWVWNGSSWDQVSTSGPAARQFASMAYDEAIGQMLLFGGGLRSRETGPPSMTLGPGMERSGYNSM